MIKNKSSSFLVFLTVILASFVGGGLPVYVKLGLKTTPPFIYTFLRFLLALFFLIPFLIKNKFSIKKNIHQVILVSLLSTINVILFSFGVRLTQASVGQLIYASVPIIVAIISYFILNEKFSLKKIIGIFFGLLGTSFIIIIPLIGNVNLKTGLIGNLLILLGAFLYALYSIYSKKIQKDFSPLQISVVFFITTMVISFFFGLPEIFIYQKILPVFDNSSVFSLFYVSIFGTAAYYLLNQYAIKYGSPLMASMILYLQPAATLIWASIVLGEQITWQLLFGGILALFGAWLVSKK